MVGAMAGTALLIGAVLSHVPVLAVVALFLFGIAAVELAQRRFVGQLVVTLALPLVGVGLSYSDVAEATGLAVILVGGSI